MSKVEAKKEQKRQALLDSAYELFTTVGFRKTAILAIAIKAGVGKGTFYLYFKDKEDIRDALILRESSRILTESVAALEKSGDTYDFADGIIYIIDHIIDYLMGDMQLLKFISKNLSWGLLATSSGTEESIDFEEFVTAEMKKRDIELKDPKMLIFTLIELTNATCYNVILNEEPVTIAEYKPYLYDTIRRIVADAIV